MKWAHYYSHFMKQMKMIKSEELAPGNTGLSSRYKFSHFDSRAKYVLKSLGTKWPPSLTAEVSQGGPSVNRNLVVSIYFFYHYSS